MSSSSLRRTAISSQGLRRLSNSWGRPRVSFRRALRALDLGTVGQRRGNPVAVPWPAAVEVAAQVLEIHPVHVPVEGAADLAVGGGASGRCAGDVELRLREDRAAARRDEPEAGL